MIMASISIGTIAELTSAKVVCGNKGKSCLVEKAFSSDLMSDVLRLESENLLLITGLANLQAVRTAEMADISYILFVRGKQATPEMVALAKENGITILETGYSLYKTSGILYSAGLKPVF